MKKKITDLDTIIDFKGFAFRILDNWFYLLLSILISIAIAFGYTRYSKSYYKSSVKILVKNDETSAADILYNTMENTKGSSINDKIELFTRFPLIAKTVEDLRFDISYFIVGNIKTSETYIAPIKVIADLEVTQNNANNSFTILVLNDTQFQISNDKLNLDRKFSFGETIKINDYRFFIKKDTNFILSEGYPETKVEFRGIKRIAKQYQAKIEVKKLEKDSYIIELFVLEEDQKKGVVFLNKLVENYIEDEIEYKKQSSINTVKFINNEIQNIGDSLDLIESKLQDYKNSHQIPDLDLKTRSIYDKISNLESELAIYKYQEKYYSYLESYIKEGNSLEKIIAPSTYGITNLSLSEMIQRMAHLQLEKNVLIEGGQIDNPSINDFNLQLQQLSLNALELIGSSQQSNQMVITDLKNRINIEESSLGLLPLEQRELKSIERIQRTSEELYTFLLQKKSEAEITSSSITSNIQIIEPANYFKKDPVSPNSTKVYSICIVLGILFPLLILLIKEIINDKINSRIDLERITDIDLIGVIGRNHSGHSLLTKLSPKSSIAEGFRALRSNLNYLEKSEEDIVYLVTSSISGEGKTFVAANLALVFANAGKKTLLLGADLRRPKLFKEFDTDNSKGLSSLLRDRGDIEDVITDTNIDNLDVIVSGPLPSNPSDVFVGESFANNMNILRKKYDKIIIDTAPIGLVADAYMIMKYSDVNLYIIRQHFTNKNVLRFVNDLYEKERINNLFLVLNDVSSGTGVYGYGKYGYGYYGYGGYGYTTYINDSDYFDDEN